ncbi:hypothetical protein N7448_008974 [Penicillium atrosanguineum]|nr:hypothetical protein N7448_008969 [Penicillium atrosanguineum]KAJ5125105.1 hypothetical protein N7448_008972 [Penicillium atrosanguineum]KAJ5125107.1 hypothetical protein N7448_008974 [Penicillium atrosanguineum]KAJ5148422.1 hypothetical protein N7526_001774 [Penicillium atrosanguineum]
MASPGARGLGFKQTPMSSAGELASGTSKGHRGPGSLGFAAPAGSLLFLPRLPVDSVSRAAPRPPTPPANWPTPPTRKGQWTPARESAALAEGASISRRRARTRPVAKPLLWLAPTRLHTPRPLSAVHPPPPQRPDPSPGRASPRDRSRPPTPDFRAAHLQAKSI